MEYLKEYAEIISAWVAFITFGVAVIELYYRNKAKKAENAMKIYADYLFIEQQLNYSIENIKKLINNCRKITTDEIQVFAKSHLLDTRIIKQVEKIESNFISNTNFKKAQGKHNSEKALKFTGETLNIMTNINSFYMVLVKGDILSVEWIEENGQRICADFKRMTDLIKQAGNLFQKNLKKQHNFYRFFIIVLFMMSIGFLIVLAKDLWCQTIIPVN